jgi:hypothetical protein
VAISLQAFGNIVWIKVVVFHLRKNRLVDRYLVEAYDDARSIMFQLVPCHPRMTADLPDRQSIVLISIQYTRNQISGVLR